jgi:predicted RNase H-like HicB family nuclease
MPPGGCRQPRQTEDEALANLKEALELHFELPQATRPPAVRMIEVEVGAA